MDPNYSVSYVICIVNLVKVHPQTVQVVIMIIISVYFPVTLVSVKLAIQWLT